MNARSTGLRRSMRARHSSTSSTGETRFARTASASAAAVSSIVKARQPYPARRGLSTRRGVSRALTARGADGAIPGLMAEPALDLLIKNVRVVRPTRPEVERGDIGVRDGRIARVAPEIAAAEARRVYDGRGRLAFPGVVDAHTHVGIYGPLAEDAVHESRAAVSGRRDDDSHLLPHGPVLPEPRRPLRGALSRGPEAVG